MLENVLEARRLVVVSPKMTVLPAAPGTPFQIWMFTWLMLEVVPEPVWYAHSVTDSRRQVWPVGTVKSSATRLLADCCWPKPKMVRPAAVWRALASAPPEPPPGCVISGPLL